MLSFFNRRPWALHNPLKSWTLSGLSLRECQLLVASMTDAEMKISWVHHENWLDWKPLGAPECHELFLYRDSEEATLPSLPQLTREDDHEITEVRRLDDVANLREAVHRKFTRFLGRIPVEIIVGGNCFNSHTVDLSEGGFCFEDKLPEWVAGYFTVALKTPERRFEITCILAEDQKKEKFRAEIAQTTSEKVLAEYRDWLIQQNWPVVPLK